MVEQLKTLEIDIEKGIYKVNGRDISHTGQFLKLTYEEGIWSLVIKETSLYTRDETKQQVIARLIGELDKMAAKPGSAPLCI